MKPQEWLIFILNYNRILFKQMFKINTLRTKLLLFFVLISLGYIAIYFFFYFEYDQRQILDHFNSRPYR